jgi:hypothetical protein
MMAGVTEDELVQELSALAAEGRFKEPPASPGMVEAAEAAIGHALPALLRRLYTEVANGGFGPRAGVLGVPGGRGSSGDFADIVDAFREFTVELPPDHEFYHPMPPGMLWILDEGCCIWTLIDLKDSSAPLWGWDPGEEPKLHSLELTLADWLTTWLNLGAPDDFLWRR